MLLFLLMRTVLVEAYKIPTNSMGRTLLVGDFLLVNKWVYGAEVPFSRHRLPPMRTLQRGDVVVFAWPPDPAKDFVKRLVGLPGDTLSMRQGALYRNGRVTTEAYVSHGDPEHDPMNADFAWQRPFVVVTATESVGMAPIYRPTRDNWGPVVVPPRHLFVLGDNRDFSLDSRYWGFVPDSLVHGTPWRVYYSFNAESRARFPWLTEVRWRRVGMAIR